MSEVEYLADIRRNRGYDMIQEGRTKMYQSIGREHQPRIVSKWKATLQAVLLQSGLTFMGLMLLVPPAYGQPTVVANFHTISLYYTRAKATSVTIRYRPSGTTLWKSAQPMWWDGTATRTAERNQYRSSLVNLSPGTTYNIQYRVDSGSWTSIPDVHTRSDTFPSSGNTVSYTGQTLRSLSITTGGSAANWRIYDGGGTASIDANHAGANACVTIGASYVILRNFTVTDCKFSAVAITRSNVVIENNIISDWGAREVDVPSRVGPSGLRLNDAAATCITGVSKADFGRSSDHGIVVNGAGLSEIVIQRNTIRDPQFRATRWNECPSWDAHPQGPRAIYFATGTVNYGKGNVIRYNDIHATNTTSSGGGVILSRPANRFHDIIGVGYQKDLDVYGNIIRNAVDDAVEADGSAVNVRIWGNYFDLSLTAVSHQRMDAGPSYIFRNIIDRGADGWTGNPGNNYVVIPGENMTVLGNRAWKLSVDNGSAAEAVFNGPVYLFHNTQLRTTNDGPGHCLLYSQQAQQVSWITDKECHFSEQCMHVGLEVHR